MIGFRIGMILWYARNGPQAAHRADPKQETEKSLFRQLRFWPFWGVVRVYHQCSHVDKANCE